MNHFLVIVRQEKHLSASLLIFHEDGRHFYQLTPIKAVGTFASPNLEIYYGFASTMCVCVCVCVCPLPNMSKPTKITHYYLVMHW
jgi:hypothetical protein